MAIPDDGDSLVHLVDSLARVVHRLDDGHLVIEVMRPGGVPSGRYVQVARQGDLIRIESIGDPNLPREAQLGAPALARLAAIGWNEPDGAGNHWIHGGPDDVGPLVIALVQTAVEVHGARKLSDLRITGSTDAVLTFYEPSDSADRTPIRVAIPCARCDRDAARLALSPEPGLADAWRWQYVGLVGHSGSGDVVRGERAATLLRALSAPLTVDAIRDLGLYDDAGVCLECGLGYCDQHWSISTTGFGTCPEGHGRSLDPHWSPSDDDW